MLDLKQTLYDIASAIVDNPDEITVLCNDADENTVDLVLNVAPDDMGMVIGRHGRIAKAIRSVMKAAGNTCGKRVNVEIK